MTCTKTAVLTLFIAAAAALSISDFVTRIQINREAEIKRAFLWTEQPGYSIQWGCGKNMDPWLADVLATFNSGDLGYKDTAKSITKAKNLINKMELSYVYLRRSLPAVLAIRPCGSVTTASGTIDGMSYQVMEFVELLSSLKINSKLDEAPVLAYLSRKKNVCASTSENNDPDAECYREYAGAVAARCAAVTASAGQMIKLYQKNANELNMGLTTEDLKILKQEIPRVVAHSLFAGTEPRLRFWPNSQEGTDACGRKCVKDVEDLLTKHYKLFCERIGGLPASGKNESASTGGAVQTPSLTEAFLRQKRELQRTLKEDAQSLLEAYRNVGLFQDKEVVTDISFSFDYGSELAGRIARLELLLVTSRDVGTYAFASLLMDIARKGRSILMQIIDARKIFLESLDASAESRKWCSDHTLEHRGVLIRRYTHIQKVLADLNATDQMVLIRSVAGELALNPGERTMPPHLAISVLCRKMWESMKLWDEAAVNKKAFALIDSREMPIEKWTEDSDTDLVCAKLIALTYFDAIITLISREATSEQQLRLLSVALNGLSGECLLLDDGAGISFTYWFMRLLGTRLEAIAYEQVSTDPECMYTFSNLETREFLCNEGKGLPKKLLPSGVLGVEDHEWAGCTLSNDYVGEYQKKLSGSRN